MQLDAYKQMYEVQSRHWWFIGKANIVENEICKIVKNAKNKLNPSIQLLDVGCGCGHMLSRLDKYGTAYGVDISSEAIAFSNLAFPNKDRIKQGHLPKNVPFENERFNVITALDVLEHIEDDKASVKALLDLLAPGSHLVVTVPAYMTLWSNHDVVLQHKRRYTKKQVEQLFGGGQ